MTRNSNLDLLRASAILLVLVHHIAQFTPGLPSLARDFAGLGIYGVDLFFVLSGWLIGNLYWKEAARFQDVQITRFLARRWLRTLPAYFAVLPLAWLAVFLVRDESFDVSYIFFLQNYAQSIPFFVVSWSLCVEEHFYLVLPFALGLVRVLRLSPVPVLLLLLLYGMLSRFLDSGASESDVFGYAYTATHLRLEGLVLGVLFSYLSQHHETSWRMVKKNCSRMMTPAVLLFLSIAFWAPSFRYEFGYTAVSLVWAIVLAAMLDRRESWLSKHRVTLAIALWSYSIYLTHSLVVHSVNMAMKSTAIPGELLPVITIPLIVLVGALLYRVVEKPFMKKRDELVPRRDLALDARRVLELD